jgi:hypothetical protein
VGGFFFGLDSAEVAYAGAAVFVGVAVEQFAPVASGGNAYAIANSRDRREVANYQNCVCRSFALAQ